MDTEHIIAYDYLNVMVTAMKTAQVKIKAELHKQLVMVQVCQCLSVRHAIIMSDHNILLLCLK